MYDDEENVCGSFRGSVHCHENENIFFIKALRN
jgi:hypothetical protein